jgi:multisubunit Na+/H+ antiporter MnhG subunit
MIIKVILMEKIEMMKKIILILGIVFLTLAFIGGFHVIDNYGEVNAGYEWLSGGRSHP